ncbi:hypothetical protein BC830DRAFT_234801 [Chytriomyces sp. MP71]|nr:hypothetical protein BC830DRAFT_234801 [Chytriomyces sp. MP71]
MGKCEIRVFGLQKIDDLPSPSISTAFDRPSLWLRMNKTHHRPPLPPPWISLKDSVPATSHSQSSFIHSRLKVNRLEVNQCLRNPSSVFHIRICLPVHLSQVIFLSPEPDTKSMFDKFFRSIATQTGAPILHRQLVEFLTNNHLFRQFVHRTNHHLNHLQGGTRAAGAPPKIEWQDPHAEPGVSFHIDPSVKLRRIKRDPTWRPAR